MAQLWYLLTVWIPTTAEYQAIQQVMRGFLWGKSWDSSSKSATVAWKKVVQPKDEGGLGLVDPMVKAKALQVQWLLRSLAPGKEPWKALIRYRLDQASVVPGAGQDWLWAMTENPSLNGLRSASSLWQHMWRSWKAIRPFVVVRKPKNLEEALPLPICGIDGVWEEAGNAFFRKATVVSEMTRLCASTLYSLWQAPECECRYYKVVSYCPNVCE